VGGIGLSDFTVYPAIDLRGGRCVRLKQGDFGRAKEYDADPLERAREWVRQGAQAVHVVDLDGAEEGRPVQLELIGRIAMAVGVPLQVGGGIRSLEDLRAVRGAGAQRVVMGTAAVEDKDLRLRAVEAAGDSVVVAVDASEGVVATHGWLRSSGVSVVDLSKELIGDGVASVLYTDIARDGMNVGAALEGTATVAQIIPTVASGGVRGPEDVAALSRTPGVLGVVVGTALYEGKVTLRELISSVQVPRSGMRKA
jgi:phosphoribosylformimino-5-aminoimidazole carboxamide ribotide isomerase